VGSHPAGQLFIQTPANALTANVVITAYESDASGNPDQQLWYLGSSSSSNQDIIFLNRRSANLHLGTNGAARVTVSGGGNVGIGTQAPATSALLELSSTTGALLPTRMTTTQRNALTAVNGMILYNSTLAQMQGRVGAAWVDLGAGAGGGEANTHSSDGGGLALTAATPKVGVDLRLVSLAAADFDLAADLFTIDDTKWAKDSELHTVFSPNADPGVDHSGLSGDVGITEVAGALSFDAAEIGTETWLDNADRSWTFDIAAAGTNPVIAFSSGIVNLSTGAWQEGGNAVPNSTDKLDFFSATTVAELAGILSDENFTPGSEASAEGVLDLPDLQGQVAAGQYAAASIDSADLATANKTFKCN
ncbi:hypothetical protein LCGC14_3017110, partial [marine sediment metagenome]